MSRIHAGPDLTEINLDDSPPAEASTLDPLATFWLDDDRADTDYEVAEIVLGDDHHEPSKNHACATDDLDAYLASCFGGAPEAEGESVPLRKTELRLIEARALMERPFFALARKPIAELPPYTDSKCLLHLQVTATDPTKGVATLADADILIVLTSLMNANRGPGRHVDPQVYLPAAKWLQLCGRLKDGGCKGGRQYRLLDEALERLRGTCITTNIEPTGQPGPTRSFSLLADWSRQGRSGLTLTAGDWLVEAVSANAVLSLSRSYFDLPGGYARWLYRTARKHAGTQAKGVAMRISTLRMKSGSISPAARFRFELKRLVDEDGLPDYVLGWIPSKLGRESQVSMRYAERKFFSMVAVRASAARVGSKTDDLAEIVL